MRQVERCFISTDSDIYSLILTNGEDDKIVLLTTGKTFNGAKHKLIEKAESYRQYGWRGHTISHVGKIEKFLSGGIFEL